jgi:preprotein translocase subunit Sec61beta
MLFIKNCMPQKITSPPSMAGITRFYDVKTSKIQIDPKLVMGLCIALIVVELLLQIKL